MRDDFEREYKNYAESILSGLSLSNNQSAFIGNSKQQYGQNISNNVSNEDLIDYELKLSLIKIYREVLVERHKMKKIAREYGLINNASALINNYNKKISIGNIQNGEGSIGQIGFFKEPTVSRKKKGTAANLTNKKDPG